MDWRSWWTERGERELRCILMTAWDPVGAGDVPEAWDEYDDYLDGIAQRLREGAADDECAERLAGHLRHIARDFMGLAPGATEYVAVSSALIAWHEFSYRRGGRPPREWVDDS